MTGAKRVLVTGAGGFIGRWSVPALRALGYDVHAVLSAAADRAGAAGRAPPAELAGATIHAADLLSEPDIDAVLGGVMPTHLLHFAWIATPGLYWQSAENHRWLAASRHLLGRFRGQGGRRAVVAGSCAEYDWTRVGVCDERLSPLAAQGTSSLSPYAACKSELHDSLAKLTAQSQLSAAWGRVFFQFGPYEHPDRLVPSVIRHLLSNREALCTHGRQVRSFLHVADVGSAFASILDSSLEGAVNVGSGEPIMLADLIGRIALQIGRPDLVRLGARAAPADEPALLVPDVRRLREEAHWNPRFTLDQGLADTIAWWRGHPGGSPESRGGPQPRQSPESRGGPQSRGSPA